MRRKFQFCALCAWVATVALAVFCSCSDEMDDLGYKEISYGYVDLGLPSGLKWATCNVGATSPEQAGLYFAWGETVGYTAAQIGPGGRRFTRELYRCPDYDEDLDLSHDAAHAYMGGSWRMPTETELRELVENCSCEWTADYNGTGVSGYILRSRLGDGFLFFPSTGYASLCKVVNTESGTEYWTSTKNGICAKSLYFNSGVFTIHNGNRTFGLCVRGVRK